LGVSSGLLPSGFPTKNLYALLLTLIRVTGMKFAKPEHSGGRICIVSLWCFTILRVLATVRS
jgi:hypothetical protein